jgi:hypothetical protein
MLALTGRSLEPCHSPPVSPSVEVSDLQYDYSKPPPAVGEPAGDGTCELYCGIQTALSDSWIPACASYSCTFTLRLPNGRLQTRQIELGPHVDGMTNPTQIATICMPWSESFPIGQYQATLECEDSSVRFDFAVARSYTTGFDLPPASWQGSNRCPSRPALGETLNPSSLQRN